MRPISIGGVETTSKTDNRTNIIGFILNIINTVLFVSFELLLCALSFFLELKEMTEETPAAIAIPITVQKISWDLV